MNTIFWDWNGTLVDDMFLVYGAMCKIFYDHGKEPPTFDEYIREFNGDHVHIYRDRGVDTTRVDLNNIFVEFYLDNINHSDLMDGAMDVLSKLHCAGIRMYLLTGQLEHLVEPFWARFEIREYFNAGTYYHVTDKENAIKEIIVRERLSPHECFLIGDTPADIEHAQRAEVKQIAFLGKSIKPEVFNNLCPDYVISNLREIPNILGVE